MMKQPSHVWSVFGICLAVAIAGMAWLSYRVVELERAEAERNFQADFEGNVRLALRRMDLVVSQLLAEQNAWPYLAYESAYRPPSTGKEPAPLVASPLRSPTSPLVKLYFQVTPAPEMAFESPGVPTLSGKDGAAVNGLPPQQLAHNRSLLDQLERLIDAPRLLAELPPPRPWTLDSVAALTPQIESNAATQSLIPSGLSLGNDRARENAELPTLLPPAQPQSEPLSQSASQSDGQAYVGQAQQAYGGQGTQTLRNDNEYNRRVQGFQAQIGNIARQIQQREQINIGANQGLAQASAKDFSTGVAPLIQVSEGLSRPVWFGRELILARRVMVGDRSFVQGCWIDWQALKRMLAAEVVDLLPQVDLTPVLDEKTADPGRMLATLKAQLVVTPPELVGLTGSAMSPVRLSLLAAWIGLGLAAVAAVILLRGVLILSERRATFVSAVTHELRTPLTTFRMYTEMLAEGMITEESQRRHYLGTLKLEAERLFHLIENVLSYARLERGRRPTTRTQLSVQQLFEPMVSRLEQRAVRDAMQLEFDLPDEVGHETLLTDPALIEQILVNLVDNACKYAAAAGDRRIHLEVERSAGSLTVRVRDHGPGISAADARRLFRPFTKSARDAAQSAPGVGLGLALSRGIARDLGGSLAVERRGGSDDAGGATLVLTLPIQRTG